MSRHPHLTVAIAAAVLVLLPATAAATTTVSRSGDVVSIVGDDAPSRIVTEAYFTRAQVQDDLRGAVVAGGGCAQLSASSVDCGDFGPAAQVIVDLGGGDDYYKWATIDPPQQIDGGAGNDVIEAGAGNDVVRGGPGNDDLNGGRGDDQLDGGEGNDKVDGWDGSDTVIGGPGVDTLLGDGGTIYAGGNDTIGARDGENDSVDCGGGADRAQVDAGDVVSGCATVERGRAAPVTPTDSSSSALQVATSIVRAPGLGSLRGGAAATVSLTPTSACAGQVALAVTAGEAKRLRIGRKATTIGTSAPTTLAAGTATQVTVSVARRYRGKLPRTGRVSAAIVTVCVDAAGGTFAGQRGLTLRP